MAMASLLGKLAGTEKCDQQVETPHDRTRLDLAGGAESMIVRDTAPACIPRDDETDAILKREPAALGARLRQLIQTWIDDHALEPLASNGVEPVYLSQDRDSTMIMPR